MTEYQSVVFLRKGIFMKALITACCTIIAVALLVTCIFSGFGYESSNTINNYPYALVREDAWSADNREKWSPYSHLDGIYLRGQNENLVYSWDLGMDKPLRIDLNAIKEDINKQTPDFPNAYYKRIINSRFAVWIVGKPKDDETYLMVLYDFREMRIAKIVAPPKGFEWEFFNVNHVTSKNSGYFPLLLFGKKIETFEKDGTASYGDSHDITVAVLDLETLEIDYDYPVYKATGEHTPVDIRSMVLTEDLSQVMAAYIYYRVVGFRKGDVESVIYPKLPENVLVKYLDCARTKPILLGGDDRNNWIDRYDYETIQGINTRKLNVPGIYDIIISPDDRYVLIRSNGHYLFDLDTMKLIQTIREPGFSDAATFSPSGDELAIFRNGKMSLFKR